MSLGETISSASTVLGNNVKVSKATATSISRSVNSGDNGTYIKLNYSSGLTFHTGVNGTVGVDFDENSYEKMRITQTGNVGIGTNNPTAKLHNTGTTQLDNAVYLSSLGYWTWSGGIPATMNLTSSSGNGLSFGTNGQYDKVYINTAGSVGIGITSISSSAILDISSSNKGVLLPRLSTTEINAISSPSTGLVVYNTTLSTLCFYNGTAWQKVTSTNM
jgi:hypothetical protein